MSSIFYKKMELGNNVTPVTEKNHIIYRVYVCIYCILYMKSCYIVKNNVTLLHDTFS